MGVTAAQATTPGLEAEHLAVPERSGQRFADPTASGSSGLVMWHDTTATGHLRTTGPTTHLVVRARGDQCHGAPEMRVAVDGRSLGRALVWSSEWSSYVAAGDWQAGEHTVQVSYAGEYQNGSCDRNLRLDRIDLVSRGSAATSPAMSARPPAPAGSPGPTAQPTQPSTQPTQPSTQPAAAPSTQPSTAPFVQPAAAPSTQPSIAPSTAGTGPASGNPFVGASVWVDPNAPAKQAADQRRGYDPAGAAALDKIAAGPLPQWYGGWIPAEALAANVSQQLSTAQSASALPVLVAYNIPQRDCGGYSAGGAGSPEGYRRWIGELAKGIGARKAVVVLEPDALSQFDCLSEEARQLRVTMIGDAVKTLSALPAVSVYVDAGNPGWQPAALLADRLRAAGVEKARGFAVNVSNFTTNQASAAYADDISARLGGKPYLIDSSRNGNGSGGDWCNPPGRALGERLAVSGQADALTWIKRPGESDGQCNGGPAAGQFWPEYAIGLAQRAKF